MAAAVTLAVLDFGSPGLDGWQWRAAGVALLVLGNGLAWQGVAALGAKPTTGLTGELVTDGPYRFTRNPQYLGDLFSIVGFVLVANSSLVLWPSLLAVAFIVGAPFAEEPWLEARFGAAYEAYRSGVPRFLGPI